MKTSGSNTTNTDDGTTNTKTNQSKSSKKSTKSRSKSTKSESSTKNVSTTNSTSNSNTNAAISSNNALNTTNMSSSSNIYDSLPSTSAAAAAAAGGSVACGSPDLNTSGGSSKSHHKSYAGFEGRSIKIMWEQHDQSDAELSNEVCARLAEDASYKVWEMINVIKTYARHSGGVVTYDIVNDALRDSDVPPTLGAMDTDWDRIDYDGSYYFYSDKIVELTDEYRKDVTISMPSGHDFICSRPIEDKNMDNMKIYLPNLLTATFNGKRKTYDECIHEFAFSPLIGSCYRTILIKIIEILAYKQVDWLSERCWRVIRACAFNPYTHSSIDCRFEYFRLSEILICQLLATFESIKEHAKKSTTPQTANVGGVEAAENMDTDNIKQEEIDMEGINTIPKSTLQNDAADSRTEDNQNQTKNSSQDDDFEMIEDREDVRDIDMLDEESPVVSKIYAAPIPLSLVDDLCYTIGCVAANSGYFQHECLFNVLRRLKRFFDGREIKTEKEYNYIGRAVRGLFHLGEFTAREFLPYLFKINVDEVPESLWNYFALYAIYLKGPDDIFFYEWLEYVCGGDKLQPFMVYYAQYFEKFLTHHHLNRRPPTFKIYPKISVRRLEWSTLAAAMCHGDDPNRALKPKPTIKEVFPDMIQPNLRINRAGTIRFKFAGCRPVIIKPKAQPQGILKTKLESINDIKMISGTITHDILIAKRKLYKPLTNEKRIIPLSSYYYARI